MGTRFVHRLIVIIPIGQAGPANALARVIDPEGGHRTFVVPLNASGDEKDAATHLWCSWALTGEQRAAVEDLVSRIPGAKATAYDLDGEPQFAKTWSAGKGLVARRPAVEIALAVEK